MASTSPQVGSTITTAPQLLLLLFTACRRYSMDSACSRESMVSIRSSPSRGGLFSASGTVMQTSDRPLYWT